MPISLSAKKSLRKSLKNRKDNVLWKNKYKETVKKGVLADIYTLLDQLGQRNIFHKNKVKRLKSKFSRKLKSTATKSVETKKVVKKEVKKVKSATADAKAKKVAKKVVK